MHIPRIPILKPSARNFWVLFEYLQFKVAKMTLNLIRKQQTGSASAHTYDTQLSRWCENTAQLSMIHVAP
jgi:hypothetical protein